MPLRLTAFAALALVVTACGGDEPPDDSSDVTDGSRTPTVAPADSLDGLASTDSGEVGADVDDAEDIAGSPKEGAGSASGKPAAGGSPPPSTGGKPSSVPSPGGAQRHAGTLAGGDETLESGEYADEFSVAVRAGQTITVDLTSDDFDAYLILRPPTGEQVDNDDGDDGTNAHITHRATESGTYRVLPTSYSSGETGAYRVTIEVR